MRPFFKRRILGRPAPKPMIFVVDTTKAGSASNTFILPIQKTTKQVVKIDWGDGKNDLGVDGNNTHVYATGGVYTIKIYSKIFTGLYFNNTGDKSKLLTVSTFGKTISGFLYAALYGCDNLTSVNAVGILYLTTSAASMFRNCSALTVIPFFDFAKVTVTSNMLQGCTSITTIPQWNTVNVTSTASMLQGCTLLASIPLLDISNVTNCASMFQSCSALTTVPLLDMSSVTNCSAMFAYCTSLTTVPLFNLSKVTNAANMFLGVTLTTQCYSDFLINLAALPLQSGVSFHGGNSKYNTAGGVARAYLISNFGWTITDGGAAP